MSFSRIFTLILVLITLLLFSVSGCSQKMSASESSDASGSALPLAMYAEAEAMGDSAVADVAAIEVPAGATNQPRPAPGLLTAGEWNDNANYDFLLKLIQTNQDWRTFSAAWQMNPARRTEVTVKTGQRPAGNARVELIGANGQPLWTAQTDNTGTAFLFASFNMQDKQAETPAAVKVSLNGQTRQEPYSAGKSYTFSFANAQPVKPALDLMFMVDTTGSMSDELQFLNSELINVIGKVRQRHANIPTRLAINVYRDLDDEYVVRSIPFTSDFATAQRFLGKQRAGGGGDYEEAVETALNDALNNHDWDMNSSARLLFIVLDAPPHNTPGIISAMLKLTAQAAKMGVRIIPVASSGVDKNTEFLLRCLAISSGGTYVFLTDDSGIGNAHLEPTIGSYDVEKLNDLLERLISNYLE